MSRLLWIPIDVPPLPDIHGLLEPARLDEGFAFWRFLRLTEKMPSPYQVSGWKTEIAEEFPQLLRWFEHLPFVNLRNVKLNLQIRPVAGHVDFTKPSDEPALWANNHENEPCGYRILVKGSRENCLWVERSDRTRTMCQMPHDTDVYVLDHTAGMHGVAADSDRWLLFCHAEIDGNKHQEILTRSLAKHGDLAIWDD